jgi:hypothetical protein
MIHSVSNLLITRHPQVITAGRTPLDSRYLGPRPRWDDRYFCGEGWEERRDVVRVLRGVYSCRESDRGDFLLLLGTPGKIRKKILASTNSGVVRIGAGGSDG